MKKQSQRGMTWNTQRNWNGVDLTPKRYDQVDLFEGMDDSMIDHEGMENIIDEPTEDDVVDTGHNDVGILKEYLKNRKRDNTQKYKTQDEKTFNQGWWSEKRMTLIDEVIKEARWIGRIASWNFPPQMKRTQKFEEMLDTLKKQVEEKNLDKKFLTKVRNLAQDKVGDTVSGDLKKEISNHISEFGANRWGYPKSIFHEKINNIVRYHFYLNPTEDSLKKEIEKTQKVKNEINVIGENEFIEEWKKNDNNTEPPQNIYDRLKKDALTALDKYIDTLRQCEPIQDLLLEAEKLRSFKPTNVQDITIHTPVDVKNNILRIKKIMDLFEPLFKKHADYTREQVTEWLNECREKLLKKISYDDYKNNSLTDLPRLFGVDSSDMELLGSFNFKVFDDNLFNKGVEAVVLETIAYNQHKLSSALSESLSGLDVKEEEEISSHIGPKGIEGSFKIILENGITGLMETQAIKAGGYNIQVFHYRYLIKLSPQLWNAKDIKIDLTEQEIGIIKFLVLHFSEMEEGNNGFVKIPDKVKIEVERMSGGSRNWSSLIKKGLITRQEFGQYYVRRYNYFITKKGLEVVKNFKDNV